MPKFLDDNGLLYFMQKLKTIFQKQESGKGLSANDFTDAYKGQVDANTTARHTHSNKSVIDGITSTKVTNWDKAQPNVLESVKVNGTAQAITNKAVDLTVPTKVSELNNDTGFITKNSDITGNASTATKATQDASGNVITSTYSKIASPTFTGTPKAPTAAEGTNTTQIATTAFVARAISSAVSGITSISYQVVASLPESGSAGVIYLVAHSHGTSDSYDEYIWTGTAFEKIGNTDVDLSGYLQKTDMVAITNAEIDEICA